MITDEQLTAWLDGELPAEEAAALQHRLAAEPELAARLDALHLDKSALAAGFAALAKSAPPFPESEAPQGWLVRLARPAAVAALIGLAIGAGYGLGNRPHMGDWRMEVAHYQVLYVADTLTHLPPDPTRLTQEFTRASRLLGQNLDPETLGDISGLTLRRAQVLGFEGQTLIQVAYTEADGTPIAFCIIANPAGAAETLETTSLLGLASASWQDGQSRYLVIGDSTPERITRYATQIKEKISAL